MTQHLLTQILKVIRDLVMRNRPCYRDYLGTETVSTQICHGTVPDELPTTTEITCDDTSLEMLTVGETYQATINGETADYVAKIIEGDAPFVGTAEFDSDSPTGWGVFVLQGQALLAVFDDSLPAGATISVSQSKTVKRYNTRLLPENLLPTFLRKNVVASKAEVQSAAAKATAANDNANAAQTTANAAQTTANAAQTTANAAQTTANAKFQLMKQTTTTTTVEVGTVKNSTGSVPVKGLNIALGTGIKCAADGTTGRAVWNGPVVTVDMKNSQGGTVYQLKISLDQDGETYEFTSVTTAVIISNLTIEYEKVEIPAFSYSGRQKGAWLPPYLIANCLYLTSAKSMASSGTLYKITVDDTGTLKATEVTS